MGLSKDEEERLRTEFRRCGLPVVEAIIRFRNGGGAADLPVIVAGVLQRFVPPGGKDVATAADEALLIEDIGIDSLGMLEAVLALEDALGVKIDNQDMQAIRTFGDVKSFARRKVAEGGIRP
jgi:acyl carrier protein